MSATEFDLESIHRGDSWNLTVTYTTDGDLTAALITATWRDSVTGAPVFLRRNVAAGGDAGQILMSAPVTGVFVIYEVPANTSALDIKEGGSVTLRYDVQVTTAAGLVHTILYGTQQILADETR